MRLTVLSIAYPFAPVSPDTVGGAEQIHSVVERALVEAGHVSLVAGCEGSRTAGELFSVPLPEGVQFTEDVRRGVRENFQAVIDRALSSRRVDLIHMHGIDFYEYKLPITIPVLVTLHVPVSWYPDWALRGRRPEVTFQFVSEAQRRSAPAELRDSPVVPNGVRLPPLADGVKGEFAIAMGRICPEKNLHEALEAGTIAGMPVILAGQVFPYPEHLAYFREKIEPLLSCGHQFAGPASMEQKTALLAGARCLLHPTLAPETSSLVAMEALAAGTPVIAYRSGALPEIVKDGVTGFLVDNVTEMAAAIHHVHKLRREDCREAAERDYSVERMIRRYFERELLITVRVTGCFRACSSMMPRTLSRSAIPAGAGGGP